ncbi:unnamed protein product, partial [Mesorhabditis belari]|uniref:TLDc domain-containing protein n=1 Tax=Mesorhabditis belari TaxID=2138241 RepID=A0AAF3F6V9_9BILA
MGNEHSHDGKKTKQSAHDGAKGDHVDPRAKTAFNVLSAGTNTVTEAHVKKQFTEDLADSLWKYFSADSPSASGLTFEQLSSKLIPLFGTSTDIYVKICQPIHHFIKVCLESAGGQAYENDVTFINLLIKDITKHGDAWTSIVEWKNVRCPRFCHALQGVVLNKLLNYDMPNIDLSSDVLSPLQMLYLQSSLPTSYFPKDKASGEIVRWTPLYTSAMQGVSVNRFETNVFDYKGHTVSIFSTRDKRTVVIASDTTLRNSTAPYGGSDTVYYEISPALMRIEAMNSIYSNFKIRSASLGFSFKDLLKIDKELSEVTAIEVWGCAAGNSLQEQRKLREWQNNQAERNKKVPLPGNWDDNPDKSLLEMAGFQFSNERANMEMEARRREEANKS